MQVTRKMVLTAYKQPATECMVELEFDLERAIRYLGEKALRNKSKRARLGYMKVVVRPTELGKKQQATHRVDRPWWLEQA